MDMAGMSCIARALLKRDACGSGLTPERTMSTVSLLLVALVLEPREALPDPKTLEW
jgi:hypothetical protein